MRHWNAVVEAMRLGATVTGRLQLEGGAGISIPASALTATNAKPAVWVVDPQNLTVSLRNVEVARFDPATAVISSGLEPGDIVVTAGVQALHPGQKVRLLGADVVIGPNLSEWALKHRSFIIFMMIAVTLAGMPRSSASAATKIRPSPSAPWSSRPAGPARRMDDTLQQVTERLERTLQETPGLDFLRSYTIPGRTTIFVNLKGSTKAAEVPDIWYQVRKNVGDIRGTLPAGVVGPGFNDDFGDTFGMIYGFTADGFTHRELRDYVEDIRSRLLQVPDVSKIELLGAQDEQIFIEFSTQRAGRPRHRPRGLARGAAGAERGQPGRLSRDRRRDSSSLRVSGAFESEADILNVNFLSNGRLIRLRDIATVRRGYSRSAAADVPRQRQAGDRPRHRHARRRRHPGARPQRQDGDRREHRQSAARHRADRWSPTSRSSSERAIGEFMDIAVAGDRHHHGGELRQPRRAAGRRGGAVDPADAGHRVSDHGGRCTSTCSAFRSAR